MFFRSLIGGVITAVLSLVSILVIAVLVYIYSLSKELPDYRQLKDYKLPTVTRFYAEDQTLLAEYAYENRLYVPISAIPRRLVNAFLAAEDRKFYENTIGVDIIGILRAAVRNVLNRDLGKLEGGSTITQQVVKNILLSNEKTFERKIKEMILAYRITKTLDKDRIMELYLNKIYFGHGSYGVASAALKYFNKSINELSLAEEALLAALPQAPSRLDPTKNNTQIFERRNWVLQRMVEAGFIDSQEAIEVKFQPIVLDRSHSQRVVKADFFSEEVRKELVKNYGSDTLYTAGLFVRTTLVSSYQKLAEKFLTDALIEYDNMQDWRGSFTNISVNGNWLYALRSISDPAGIKGWKLGVVIKLYDAKSAMVGIKSGELLKVNNLAWARGVKVGDVVLVDVASDKTQGVIRQIPKVNGAVVILDVSTGKVLAMVGGYDYELSKFNVAIQAMRQPGSIVKPLTYIAALESNFTNNSVIKDERLEFVQGPNLPMWVPNNFEKKFFGDTTLRAGLELSRNIVALQVAKLVGLDKVHDVAKRFGLYRDLAFYNMSSILGAIESNLLDVTNAYAMIANGGFRTQPAMIEYVQDREGNTIYKREKRRCNYCDNLSNLHPRFTDDRIAVTDKATAYQMVSLLEGAVQRGTSKGLRHLNLTLGGKTGTSNDNRDAWFVGITPDIAIGVYVGFDKPQALGRYYTGARIALPIFKGIIKEISKNKPRKPFKVPDSVKFVKVHYKTGKLANQASNAKDVITEVVPTDFVISKDRVANPLVLERLKSTLEQHGQGKSETGKSLFDN